jgi:ABC-type transport system involved in multi-copper enzyme maturation permease subunit
MRFLAIVEDSFREAAASYVSLVQLALTIIFVLLMSSVSFEPMDAAAAFQPLGPYLAETFHTDLGGPSPPPLAYSSRNPFMVSAAQPVDGPATPSSTYRVTLSVQCADVATAESLQQAPEPMREFIRHQFGRIGNWRYVETTDVRLLDGNTRFANPVRFEVMVRPTADMRLLWPHNTTALFGLFSVFGSGQSMSLGASLWTIENHIMNVGAAWIVVLLSIVVTAFIIPNMLRKGAVDLLLVRPLNRPQLLLYRYLSGVLYVGTTVGLMFGVVWLVLGLRSGVWKPGLLLSVPVITFFFAVLYAASTLIGVVSRSAVAAILMTCIIWFGLWILSMVYGYMDMTRNQPGENDWAYPIVDTLHAVLPRTADLDLLLRKVLVNQLVDEQQGRMLGVGPTPAMTWSESLAVSLGFIAVLLALASWRFHRKDY